MFKGLREGVTNLSFSHDEKFLAATGLNNTISIWNCSDSSLVHNKVFECPVSFSKQGISSFFFDFETSLLKLSGAHQENQLQSTTLTC